MRVVPWISRGSEMSTSDGPMRTLIRWTIAFYITVIVSSAAAVFIHGSTMSDTIRYRVASAVSWLCGRAGHLSDGPLGVWVRSTMWPNQYQETGTTARIRLVGGYDGSVLLNRLHVSGLSVVTEQTPNANVCKWFGSNGCLVFGDVHDSWKMWGQGRCGVRVEKKGVNLGSEAHLVNSGFWLLAI